MEIDELKLNSYIKVYENFLPKKVNEKYTKYVCSLKEFEQGAISGEEDFVNKTIRNVLIFNCTNLEQEKSFTNIHWTNLLMGLLTNKIKEYFLNFNESCNHFKVNTLQILKYNVGGHYKVHSDMGSRTPRSLSFIYLVNDNYEGGDLIFFSPVSNKQIKIKNKKNTLIVWPSNFLYPHGVTPVTKGVRYSVVAWAV